MGDGVWRAVSIQIKLKRKDIMKFAFKPVLMAALLAAGVVMALKEGRVECPNGCRRKQGWC